MLTSWPSAAPHSSSVMRNRSGNDLPDLFRLSPEYWHCPTRVKNPASSGGKTLCGSSHFTNRESHLGAVLTPNKIPCLHSLPDD